MAANSAVEELKKRVAGAAQALSQTRCFSAESLLVGLQYRGPVPGVGLQYLRCLLLGDSSGMINADAERRDQAEIERDLAGGDRDTLLKHASRVLKRWMPSVKRCAVLCRQCAAPAVEASAGADGGKKGGGAADEQNERESERSKYKSFDKDKMAVQTLNPQPSTPHPSFTALNPQPSTLNP